MNETVLLADDQPMFRGVLRTVLEREGFEVVGEAGDGRRAVRLAVTLHPMVVVLDVAMPLLNGIDAARAIRRQTRECTKVVLLTMYEESVYALEALRAGIRGYVLKTQASADLATAIREVASGTTYLSPAISGPLVNAFRADREPPSVPLTDREREVLQLIAEGSSTKQVARVLDLSVRTADSHRTRIMHKLDLHTTADLVRYAVRCGVTRA